MSWEMVPGEALKSREVWEALSRHMPINALVRNLATLTRVGVIEPMNAGWAVNRLERIGNGGPRIHPVNVLKALLTYRHGKGSRGRGESTPVAQISDALDAAFDRSFDTAPSTGKRIYLGLDVSGSMSGGNMAGVPGLTPRMAGCAMAMVIARREPNHVIRGFSRKRTDRNIWKWSGNEMADLDISARDGLTDAMRKTEDMPFGGTDCALPMLEP